MGGTEFVEQMREEIERSEHGPRGGSRRAVSLKVLIERVCQVERVRVASVEGGGRRAELCRVREGIAYLCVDRLEAEITPSFVFRCSSTASRYGNPVADG